MDRSFLKRQDADPGRGTGIYGYGSLTPLAQSIAPLVTTLQQRETAQPGNEEV